MGTNFYYAKRQTIDEKLHIGKRSGGWHFALCIHPTKGILSLEDWKKLFDDGDRIIFDDYGTVYSNQAMLKIIETPLGDRRHPLDNLCIGYGPAYDICEGEFS